MPGVRLLCLLGCLVLIFNAGFAQATHSENANKQLNTSALRVKTNIVNLAVSVLDRRGASIAALEARHFEVYEDGIKQNLEYFNTEDEPLSIGIILDTSGSMQSQLAQARGLLQTFIRNSHPDDEFFLLAVNDSPQLLTDFAGGAEIKSTLPLLEAEGNTTLYDGIAAGLKKLQRGRYTKRALLVLSDGEDNQSRIGYRKLLQQVKETDAQIYSVGYANTSSTSCGRICQMQAKAKLTDLAAVSGGESFFTLTRAEFDETIERIALRMRQQYSLGYLPANDGASEKWRQIEIKIQEGNTKNKFVVRTRKGYFYREAQK